MKHLFLLLAISLFTFTSFASSTLSTLEENTSIQNFELNLEINQAFDACYGNYQRTVTNPDGSTYIERRSVYLGEASNYFQCLSMALAHLEVMNQ